MILSLTSNETSEIEVGIGCCLSDQIGGTSFHIVFKHRVYNGVFLEEVEGTILVVSNTTNGSNIPLWQGGQIAQKIMQQSDKTDIGTL
jgi:hypothetical protein